LDIGQELRDCENQTQLKFAQQRVARLQRVSDEKGDMFKGKQLTHVPKYIKAEAKEQAEYIAERKKAKELAKKGPPADPELVEATASAGSASSSTVPAASEELLVECAVCGKQHPWSQLSAHDGVCEKCTGTAASALPPPSTDDVVDEISVECSHCPQTFPWSLLQLGDGACPDCFRKMEELRGVQPTAETQVAAADSAGYPERTHAPAAAQPDEPAATSSVGAWRRRRAQQEQQ